MHFIVQEFSRQCFQTRHHHLLQAHIRTLVGATTKWVRDRGLDHAVEKEKNLLPMINVKNFIKAEPAKSVPISVIAQNKESLKIPIRPIDFIRLYPSIFEEFLPGGIGIHPHVRLSSQVLELDAEEQLIYQSENFRQDGAARLLKLLMLSRIHRIPLSIIDCLKWDLGLPQDYVQSIVPEFPDYFRVVGAKDSASVLEEDTRMLELVCWSNDLATSVMEKQLMKAQSGYSKGLPAAFPMQFSSGFEMDKKFKKWMDDWQKLPYISPYENASHLQPKSDESDKWAVAVLHELLNILVAKKMERENLLFVGEYYGLRSRFKRALLNHPGIFYVSSKIGTYTVVLKEGYKRGSLIENNPLMIMRNRYTHLMNVEKDDNKAISKPLGDAQQQKQSSKSEEKGEEDDDSGERETEMNNLSEAEIDSDEEEKEEEYGSRNGGKRHVGKNRSRGRSTRNDNVVRHSDDSVTKSRGRTKGRTLPCFNLKTEKTKDGRGPRISRARSFSEHSRDRSDPLKQRKRSAADKRAFIV